MLKVSVIIPVFNSGKHLERCLDSVKNQHFKNLEILLIDDASTDESVKICEKYVAEDERFTLFRHEESRGIAAARNTGLDNASGDFLYFLDSDLWIEPGCISRLAKVMADEKSDMSLCSYIYEHSDEKKPNTLAYVPVGVWSVEKYIQNQMKSEAFGEFLWNKMFKRKLFAGVRFDESNTFAEIALLPEVIDVCMKISSFNRVLIHYPVTKETSVDCRSLDKLSALDKKAEFYEENYPKYTYWPKRQALCHCLKLLAVSQTTDELKAFVSDKLRTLSKFPNVCTLKLRLYTFLALHFPALFGILVNPQKLK